MCLCVCFYPVSGVEQGGRKRERIRSKRERDGENLVLKSQMSKWVGGEGVCKHIYLLYV